VTGRAPSDQPPPETSPADRWSRACEAAALLAVDPAGLGGAALRAPAGEPRAAWLALIRRLAAEGAAGQPVSIVQAPADSTPQQLLGGLDFERTLALGRPVAQAGALARADGGLFILAMAERCGVGPAGLVAAAMDAGEVAGERDGVSTRAPARFGLIALDEGIAADERPPAALAERMAFAIDLSDVTHRDIAPAPPCDVAAARARLAGVVMPDGAVEAICAAALALGVDSGRAPVLALRACRAAAALAGRSIVSEADIVLAAGLVLGHRATRGPAAEEQSEPQQPEPRQPEQQEPPPEEPEQADAPDAPASEEIGALEDAVLAAAAAAIPADLLQMLKSQSALLRSRESGKSGDGRTKGLRGRPIGSRRGDLRSSARLDLLDTLRAAAPWQKLRRAADGAPGLRIRRADVRLKRFKDRQASTTIFVVDASGSAAMDRLGEAKGAVELLLADCYVRRDEVALIAFRGARADILLPATRSLTRARRSLAALPGGGGTPLASGLAAAETLADEARRKGRTPTLVVITDGRANVARDGTGGRERAHAEAEAAARAIAFGRTKAILVDNSPRPEPKAQGIARSMGALYLALPHVSAALLSDAVRAHGAKRPDARS